MPLTSAVLQSWPVYRERLPPLYCPVPWLISWRFLVCRFRSCPHRLGSGGSMRRPAPCTVSAQPHSDIFIDPSNGSADAGAGTALNAESMLNAVTLLGGAPTATFSSAPGSPWTSPRPSTPACSCSGSTSGAGPSCASSSRRRASPWSSPSSAAASPMTRTPSRCPAARCGCGSRGIDRAYAYHASLDGRTWQMIRVFILDDETSARQDRLRGPVADRRRMQRDLRRDPIPVRAPR